MKKIKSLVLVFLLLTLAVSLLPSNVFAAEDVFEEVLTNGKLVIPSVKPETTTLATDTACVYLYDDLGSSVSAKHDSWNSSFTQVTLSYYPWPDPEQTKTVEVVWSYDESVKEKVDAIVANYPTDKKSYTLSDYEVLSYRINGGGIPANSTEFKKNIGYKNFKLDTRGGGGLELITSSIGIMKFKVDGVLYWIGPDTQFVLNEIVYVDESATDVAAALEARLAKLFPDHTFEVSKLENGSTTTSIINDYITECTNSYNANESYFVSQGYATLEDYLASKTDYDFLDGAEENLYDIGIDDAFGFSVAVKKDSSKAVEEIEFITSDVATDITISAGSSAEIPLDTQIGVTKLTSGSQYDKIISLLDVTNSEMFDLKLYSRGIDDYITKLEDGSFEVKIPISSELKGKDLVVYYVDDNDKVVEYKVTKVTTDGTEYAVFTTDHFSVYTLASTDDEKDETPKTGAVDYAGYALCTMIISVAGIMILKKKA